MEDVIGLDKLDVDPDDTREEEDGDLAAAVELPTRKQRRGAEERLVENAAVGDGGGGYEGSCRHR